MPGYQTHFSTGIAITLIVGSLLMFFGLVELSLSNVGILLLISFVYSLLPDIDIGTSIIRKVAVVSFVIYFLIYGLNSTTYLAGIVLILIQFLHHRQMMHSILTGIALSGLLLINYDWPFALIALINFISHLYLDN